MNMILHPATPVASGPASGPAPGPVPEPLPVAPLSSVTPAEPRRPVHAGGLGRRALRGLISMLAQNVVARLTSFGSQLVLASLLQPRDFGLIGLAWSVTGIVSALTDVGVEDVLVRRKDRLWLWSGPAFWIMAILLTAGGLMVAIAAPLAARAYHAPALLGLLLVAALSMPFSALTAVPGAVLRSALRFDFIAGYGAFEVIASAALTIGFAAAGLGAYSFVLPLPILALLRSIVWFRAARASMPINFRVNARRWRFLIGNTTVTFATRLCQSAINQGGYLILGLVTTQSSLGAYFFGFRLASQPLLVLAGNFTNVLFPALVQLKHDPVRQGAAALRASHLLSCCVMPMAIGQAAVASPLIEYFFARRWGPSIPIIQLLSVALAFDAVSWLAGALLGARGEFKAQLRNQLAQMPVYFLLVAIGAREGGAMGTAIGVCAYYMTTQPLFVFTVFRRIGIGAGAIAALYLRPAALSLLAFGVALALADHLIGHAFLLVRAAVTLAVGSIAYAGLLRAAEPAVWAELGERLGGLRRRMT